MNQKTVIATFEVTQVCNIAGKVTTRSRQNSGFSNLTTKLTGQSILSSELGEAEAGNKASTLGKSKVEDIAVIALHRSFCIRKGAERFAR